MRGSPPARGRSLDDIRLERLLGASVARRRSARSARSSASRWASGELRAALARELRRRPARRRCPGARELVAELAARDAAGGREQRPAGDRLRRARAARAARRRSRRVVSAEETAARQAGAGRVPGGVPAARRRAVRRGRVRGLAARRAGGALRRARRRAGAAGARARAVDADLVVARLDDARLRAFLGLVRPRSGCSTRGGRRRRRRVTRQKLPRKSESAKAASVSSGASGGSRQRQRRQRPLGPVSRMRAQGEQRDVQLVAVERQPA